jgi:hypothetical protein
MQVESFVTDLLHGYIRVAFSGRILMLSRSAGMVYGYTYVTFSERWKGWSAAVWISGRGHEGQDQRWGLSVGALRRYRSPGGSSCLWPGRLGRACVGRSAGVGSWLSRLKMLMREFSRRICLVAMSESI